MSNEPTGVPPHFLVIIPGIMGSKLRDKKSGEIAWLDFSTLANPLNWPGWFDRFFERLAYPSDLEPAGVVDSVVFVPPWAKLEQYSRLVAAVKKMGYQIDPESPAAHDPCAYTFAYDWRQDNRTSAAQLSAAIDGWQSRHPGAKAWIIAHSNGGLVARWYIEQLGGKDHVGRLMLMASPRDGAPKALEVMFGGMILLRAWPKLLNIAERSRDAMRTFPCAYQLLPYENPFLHRGDNEAIDIASGLPWLSDDQRALLLDAHAFHQTLGTTSSVPTLCFFGRRQQTTTAGLVRFAAGGNWEGVEWVGTEFGDGTVPERSILQGLPDSIERLPYLATHGDIYVHPAALTKLEWELVGRYGAPKPPDRAALVAERLTLVFEPDRDLYAPGDPINLWATINRNADGGPVAEAKVEVKISWRDNLPGNPPSQKPGNLPTTRLRASKSVPGRYEGHLIAPPTPGYYDLEATFEVIGEPAFNLQELIAVEESIADLPN